jgi:hypothetical protein
MKRFTGLARFGEQLTAMEEWTPRCRSPDRETDWLRHRWVVCCGGTGEGVLLSAETRREMAETLLQRRLARACHGACRR